MMGTKIARSRFQDPSFGLAWLLALVAALAYGFEPSADEQLKIIAGKLDRQLRGRVLVLRNYFKDAKRLDYDRDGNLIGKHPPGSEREDRALLFRKAIVGKDRIELITERVLFYKVWNSKTGQTERVYKSTPYRLSVVRVVFNVGEEFIRQFDMERFQLLLVKVFLTRDELENGI